MSKLTLIQDHGNGLTEYEYDGFLIYHNYSNSGLYEVTDWLHSNMFKTAEEVIEAIDNWYTGGNPFTQPDYKAPELR